MDSSVTPIHHHAVQFYGSEESLFTTVAGFLGEGLVTRQPAIVIATPAHRLAIEEHLCGRLIDCAQARHFKFAMVIGQARCPLRTGSHVKKGARRGQAHE